MKNLINWKEVSRQLTGGETNISRNRIPKKYQSKIDALLEKVKEWKDEHTRTNRSTYDLYKQKR